jgi:hypothetical protein
MEVKIFGTNIRESFHETPDDIGLQDLWVSNIITE